MTIFFVVFIVLVNRDIIIEVLGRKKLFKIRRYGHFLGKNKNKNISGNNDNNINNNNINVVIINNNTAFYASTIMGMKYNNGTNKKNGEKVTKKAYYW